MAEIQSRKEPHAIEKGFLDIRNPDHRQQALDCLMNGDVIAVECLGPFGLMAAVDRNRSKAKAETQVNKLGLLKGRDMSRQPAPFFAPTSRLDEIIEYSLMTRDDLLTFEQTRKSLKHAMINSGAFFQIVLRSALAEVMPYTQPSTVLSGGKEGEVQTGVVACLDKSYPALALLIEDLWDKGMVPMITSANESGKQATLTSAVQVAETFIPKKSDLLIVDNPGLKQQLSELEVEQCSYTLVLYATGWSEERKSAVEFVRQGNVDPVMIIELLNEVLEGDFFKQEGAVEIVLTNNPFFRSTDVFSQLADSTNSL